MERYIEVLKKNWMKVVAVLSAICVVVIGIILIIRAVNRGGSEEEKKFEGFATVLFIDGLEDLGEGWKVKVGDKTLSDAEIRFDEGLDGYSLLVNFYKPAMNSFMFTKPDGTELKYDVGIDVDNIITVDKVGDSSIGEGIPSMENNEVMLEE